MFGFGKKSGSDRSINPSEKTVPANVAPVTAPSFEDEKSSEPQVKVNCDLYRLARFGANIADAHSCLIFLPANLMAQLTCSPSSFGHNNQELVIAGYHSLCSDIVKDFSVASGTGLIGWVAKHGRSIHVSPFEMESRTLGIYSTDQQLKSFIGVPINLTSQTSQGPCWGVIACDSKKSYAFSKPQGKLLEDLAAEVANTVQLLLSYSSQGQSDIAWQTFLRRSEELASALGHNSIELMRLKTDNFDHLETTMGTSGCLYLSEQMFRLFQQALPPHFPITRLINGDILVCLDSMMSSFYENKFNAICNHIASLGRRPVIDFVKASFRDKKRRPTDTSIEALAALTACSPRNHREENIVRLEKEITNEYRRA